VFIEEREFMIEYVGVAAMKNKLPTKQTDVMQLDGVGLARCIKHSSVLNYEILGVGPWSWSPVVSKK